MPIMCLKSPGPKELLELIKCSCKGKCDKRKCSCVPNNLNCTSAFLCGDCQNEDENTGIKFDDGSVDENNPDDICNICNISFRIRLKVRDVCNTVAKSSNQCHTGISINSILRETRSYSITLLPFSFEYYFFFN